MRTVHAVTLKAELSRRFTAYRIHRERNGIKESVPATMRHLIDHALTGLAPEYRDVLPLVPEDD